MRQTPRTQTKTAGQVLSFALNPYKYSPVFFFMLAKFETYHAFDKQSGIYV